MRQANGGGRVSSCWGAERMSDYLLLDIPNSPRVVDGMVLPALTIQDVTDDGRLIDITPDWFTPGSTLERECPECLESMNEALKNMLKKNGWSGHNCDQCTKGRQRFRVRDNLELIRLYKYIELPTLGFTAQAKRICKEKFRSRLKCAETNPYIIVSKDLEVVSG